MARGIRAWWLALAFTGCTAHAPPVAVLQSATTAEVLAKSSAADWRPLAPERTLYLDLAGGRVVIELAADFAPVHVANIQTLARQHYFDGLAIVRVQDNYVAQWGDPSEKRDLGAIDRHPPAEFTRPVTAGQPFTALPDGDVYAPQVGWSDGFPVGREPATGKSWLAHCYGMVGVGRDNPPDPGTGAELYAVIGHAPRHLDRNLAVVGRVVQGMDLLAALPRGTKAMGFYDPEKHVSIRQVRLAAELPAAERLPLEVLRTDTPTWLAYVDSRRHRREPFFVEASGRVELCNVPIAVRLRP